MKLRRVPLVLTLLVAAPWAASCGAPSKAAPAPGHAAVPHLEPTPRAPRREEIDVEHYALDLELLPAERRIEGTCRVRFFARADGLRSVSLDLVELEVLGVTDADGNELELTHAGGVLRVELARDLRLGEPEELAVAYGGTPRKGLWFSGGEPPTQVFTHGQCENARWWFPCLDVPDDRATSELRVTMPARWTSLAAGTLVDSRIAGGTRVDTWRMHDTHPAYLCTLVAGELDRVEALAGDVPLVYVAPRGLGERLGPCLGATPGALAFLERLTGRRYPYSKYATACVEGLPSGGMENVSATTLSLDALRDDVALRDADADALVVHELAHQWFGDLVTCSQWEHVWLNEGLATYLTAMYFEETRGVDDFRVRMGDVIDTYLDRDGARPRPIVHGDYRDPIDLFFTGHAYEGGGARLHLLRSLLGDEAFVDGLRRYVGENAGRGVVTGDLRRAFERASGQDLARFFEQWVEGPGHPRIETRWRWDGERGRVLLTVQQTHAVQGDVPEAFELVVDVEVRGAGGSRVHRVELSERRQLVELLADGEPTWVRFDKYRWIPGRVVEHKPLHEWLAILRHDDDVAGRRSALRVLPELRGGDDEAARGEVSATIAACLAQDGVAAVRAEAARALGELGGDEAQRHLVAAAREDAAPEVRAAALGALGAWCPDAELRALGEELYRERASYRVAGAAAGLVAAADPAAAFQWLTAELEAARARAAGLHRQLGGELERELLARLGRLADPRVLEVLLRYARDEGLEEAVRIAAVLPLPRHAGQSPAARRVLTDLLASPRARLRHAAVEALARIGDPDALLALADYYPSSPSPRERRVIEGALAGGQ